MYNKQLPSAQKALKYLRKSGCSQKVIDHCKSVAAIAIQIAKACAEDKANIDLQLVEIGALLHDIGRSRTHGVDHAVVGAEIAKSLNLPTPVVSIIERHVGGGITIHEAKRLGWPVKSYLPQTIEEKIVTYADKLVEGTRIVSIDRTIEKLSNELGNTHPATKRIKKIHDEISQLIRKNKMP